MFDGDSIRQLTDGESITDVDVNDDWLVYRQREVGGAGWRVWVRSLVTGEAVDLGLGTEPRLTEDRLTWLTDVGGGLVRQEYRFNAEPTATPTETVTTSPTPEAATPSATVTEPAVETSPTPAEEVMLEATAAAEIETTPTASAAGEASPSATLAP